MTFVALRVRDVAASARFYRETVAVPIESAQQVDTPTEVGSEEGPQLHLTLLQAGAGATERAEVGFLVDDVDAVYEKLTGLVDDFVNQPTTMPWGNRSLLFRDPDGNLVNFFTPVTPEAKQKFGR